MTTYEMIVYWTGRGWRRIGMRFPTLEEATTAADGVQRTMPGLITEVWPTQQLNDGLPLAGPPEP